MTYEEVICLVNNTNTVEELEEAYNKVQTANISKSDRERLMESIDFNGFIDDYMFHVGE